MPINLQALKHSKTIDLLPQSTRSCTKCTSGEPKEEDDQSDATGCLLSLRFDLSISLSPVSE